MICPLVEQVGKPFALDGDKPAGLVERADEDRRGALRDGSREGRGALGRFVLPRLVAEAVHRRHDLLLWRRQGRERLNLLDSDSWRRGSHAERLEIVGAPTQQEAQRKRGQHPSRTRAARRRATGSARWTCARVMCVWTASTRIGDRHGRLSACQDVEDADADGVETRRDLDLEIAEVEGAGFGEIERAEAVEHQFARVAGRGSGSAGSAGSRPAGRG